MDMIRQFVRGNPITSAAIVTVMLVLPSLLAWLQRYSDRIPNVTVYQLFPLLGLLAFSLMLAHVVVGTVNAFAHVESGAIKRYYQYTGYVVLACILLHPGLFIWQLYRDGYGFPPGSYLNYVENSMRAFVLLGTISLVIFLLFELKRKYGSSSWWQYIERASDTALVLIFIHGLFLGSSIQNGWFRVVWLVYGVLLLSCLVYAFIQRRVNDRIT